jgi:hypothetical protein
MDAMPKTCPWSLENRESEMRTMRKSLTMSALLSVLAALTVAPCATAQEPPAQIEGDRLQPAGVIWMDSPVTAVAMSPQPDIVAVGSKDKTALFYKYEQGRLLEGYKGATTALAFSPDGQMLAVGAEDGFVRVWNVITGPPLAVSDGRGATPAADATAAPGNGRRAVTALAWSPDGSRLAVAWADAKNAVLVIKAGPNDAARMVTGSVDLQHPTLGASSIVPILSLAWPAPNLVRGIGSGKRTTPAPAGKTDRATYFFSEAVSGECTPALCRTFEEDGEYKVELNPWNPLLAFVSSRENLMRLNHAEDANLATEARASLFIDLPASQKTQPQALNSSADYKALVATQGEILDIAYRPHYNQVLTLSRRLVSLWSMQNGAFRYAHTLAIDAHPAGFAPGGKTLYLAGKAETAGDDGGVTTRECVGFFQLRDAAPANAPRPVPGATASVRYRVTGPPGSEGIGIVGSFTGSGEQDVAIPDDVLLPWETTVGISREAIFNRHIRLQITARAVPIPNTNLTVEIFVDGQRIGDASGFAPRAIVQKH